MDLFDCTREQTAQQRLFDLSFHKVTDLDTLTAYTDQQIALGARGKGVFGTFRPAVYQQAQALALICRLPLCDDCILRVQQPLKPRLLFGGRGAILVACGCAASTGR